MTEHQYTMTAVKDCSCPRCVQFRNAIATDATDDPKLYEWNPSHPDWEKTHARAEGRFDQLLAQMKQVHDKKGQDYEAHNIPYENIKAAEQWSVEPWTYAMLRVSEKIRRLHSVAKGKTLQNEDLYDTFIDIANLALIAHILYEEGHTK